MHARHIRFQADPDRIDASTRHTEEVLLPLLRDMDGFRGFVSFGDRSTGAGVAISYWESEEAMRASERSRHPGPQGRSRRRRRPIGADNRALRSSPPDLTHHFIPTASFGVRLR